MDEPSDARLDDLLQIRTVSKVTTLVVEDALTPLLDAQFAQLPPQMRQEPQIWLDEVRFASPRRRVRPQTTVVTLIAKVGPFLLQIATRYHGLREVTHNDVSGWLDGCDECARPADDYQQCQRVERLVGQSCDRDYREIRATRPCGLRFGCIPWQ